jgi:spore germination cell wall hydrolase CwlJ-like protein
VVLAALALAPATGMASVLVPVIRPDAEPAAPFVAEVHFSLPRYEPDPANVSMAVSEAAEVTFAADRPVLSPDHREIVAACLVLEAACQGDFGMRGVMAVIRNRSGGNPERFAPTVLRKYQFSAFNGITTGRESLWRAIMRAKKDRTWQAALQIVDDAVLDSWYDPTGGATHYTRTDERTHWTRRLARTTTIGAHSFYR